MLEAKGGNGAASNGAARKPVNGGGEAAAPHPLGELRVLAATDPGRLEAAIAGAKKRLADDPELAIRLNAYRAIVAFDRGGAIGPRRGPLIQARLELDELQNGALRFDVAREAVKVWLVRFAGNVSLELSEAFLRGPGNSSNQWRDDPWRDVQVIAKPGADTTVIAFCGFQHRFGLPINVLYHVWLAPHSVNVIVLRDWQRVFYLSGVASIGTVDQSVTELLRIARSLGAERIVTTGNSAGGFGALYYGALLGAERIVTFGPTVDLRFAGSYVGGGVRTRFKSLRAAGRIITPDIAALLRENPRVHADVYFGEGHEIDRKHADVLAGLANVKLNMIAGESTHGTAGVLALNGRLEAVFRDALRPR